VPEKDQLRYHYLVHSALDIFDERKGAFQQSVYAFFSHWCRTNWEVLVLMLM
jgi:hypothetical protein